MSSDILLSDENLGAVLWEVGGAGCFQNGEDGESRSIPVCLLEEVPPIEIEKSEVDGRSLREQGNTQPGLYVPMSPAFILPGVDMWG